MAFTKTPMENTFQTKRFNFAGSQLQRSGDPTYDGQDQRYLNCFPEMIPTVMSNSRDYFLRKRPGLSIIATHGNVGRGMIYEDTTKKVFYVVDNQLVVYDGTSINAFYTIGTSTGTVGFTVHLTTSVSVVLLDGTNGYVITPSTLAVTQITNVNFPTPHVPQPVSFDGYLFVAKANTADIYNSNLDDPLTWTPGDFITAEMYPDNVVGLTKNNNYIYAVGTSSVEYFFDAGNATGSPLQRNDSAVQQFGTIAPDTVYATEKEVIMVGTTENGGRTVWMIEGFKATEVATEPVKLSMDFEGSTMSISTAYVIRSAGHKFYVLRLQTSQRTWVYDFDEKHWHEWSSLNDDNVTQGLFRGVYAADTSSGYPSMLDYSNGNFYAFREDIYMDGTNPILMQITTSKQDFENMNRKDFYRMTIFGDWPLNLTSAPIIVDWSDDDYRTWQGNRSVELCTALPVTRRLGKSRRRAFRFTSTGNWPVRLQGFELDINLGQT